MTRAFHLACVAVVALGVALAVVPTGGAVAEEPKPKPADPALHGSAVAALLEANGGKAPATGEQLWKALGKLGKFAQLPIVFSAVHLDSGIANPRVVIAPTTQGVSDADVTAPNLQGRLFLAANMEKGVNGGDPRVTLVEFISWNSLRRRFDFGVIENMGGDEQPQLKIVDGGKCFSCHKNKGPILGAAPWTNSTHFPLLQTAVSESLKVTAVVPPNPPAGVRDRIDGMALAADEAAVVDAEIRLGSLLRLNRETFRLMNRSAPGRKAFVAMLLAVVEPVVLDPNQREARRAVDAWGSDQSYLRFAADWVALTKATSTGILADYSHFPPLRLNGWTPKKLRPIPPNAKPYDRKLIEASNEEVLKNLTLQAKMIVAYDIQRAQGSHGTPSLAQPSNPKAFVQPPPRAAQKAAAMVNPVMLAVAIGLTEGDRQFLARSLRLAAERVNQPKVTAATLARAVFEGPEFADVLAGGPLPDRDEFKDRFVAGLHNTLMKDHPATKGFAPERREFASGPKYDPKLAEEVELAVVPTTACLRCHDVRPAGKARAFESIPALAFDPLDKTARQNWLTTANKERKQEVLIRMIARLYKDADMPPQDSPEHDRFRVKEAAAFADARIFLEAELARLAK
jgi:hypothetical protein